MRLHDEDLDRDLHREIDFPVFQGPTDAIAPALDVSIKPVHASVDRQGGTIRAKPASTLEQGAEQLNRGGAGPRRGQNSTTPCRATATSAC